MKTQAWMAGIVLSGAVTLTQLAAAQKFQEPTKEELQMTSDPKAPDAPAVYLYLEEKMDVETHVISEYARIKVLTEKGKEYASVHVPYAMVYNSAPVIEGRTIHSDGTVISLQGKGADLLVFKTTSENVKEAVFNMPSVEVGSILEYRWIVFMTGGRARWADNKLVYDQGGGQNAFEIPEWLVQKPIYVHKAHFFYDPINEKDKSTHFGSTTAAAYVNGFQAGVMTFAQYLPSGSQVVHSQAGDYTLDIQDVPATADEADAPPADALRFRVLFYFTPSTIPTTFWPDAIAQWSKELDAFASPSEALKAAAAQIVAGAAMPDAKARKLYDAVQALDNSGFSREKSEAERKRLHLKAELTKVDEVWREKSGSADDLAALYLALVRAAGLRADGLKIADRREAIFDQNYLSLDQLDTLLIVLHLDGKDIYLDPGEKMCPFGQLHWAHALAGGVEQNQKMPVVTPANSTKDAITAHVADLAVDATGSVSGTVQLVMNGPAALHWRQLNLTADSDEVKKQLTESLHRLLPAGMNAEIATVKGLETPEGYLQVTAKVSGAVGTVTGKRLLMPAFLFSSGDAEKTFVREDKREWPVDLHYAEQVIDDVVYHLPAGYKVESAPQAAQLPWPDHAALVVKVTADPAKNTLDVRHTFARAFALLDAKEYPALHDYYQKMATNDQQQVVLTAGTPAGQ